MEGIHLLDLQFQGHSQVIAAYLIECGEHLVLIECGAGSTDQRLISQIEALGFEVDRVKHVLVTHVHLDHAGAAGHWAQRGATIYVHEAGARHLINPSRLYDSARSVYGDAMQDLWGDMLPCPTERVQVLKDGETLCVGHREFKVWDTPGHARHHLTFELEGALFTGDVAGVRFSDSAYLSVAAAPPQFDEIAYLKSLAKLRSRNAHTLYLTHFGAIHDVQEHWRLEAQRIIEVTQDMRVWCKQGLDDQALAEQYKQAEQGRAMAAGENQMGWQRYERANPCWMSAMGLALYVNRIQS